MIKSLNMSTFLLIHGAWHGAWCWRQVAPLLEAQGHSVLAPDLPGHGDDTTPASTVTLDSYVDRICRIVGSLHGRAIVLGHSMAGAAITQAAENCPGKVAALVYLSAFLPRNGDSIMTWAQQDHENLVNPNILPLGNGLLGFRPEAVREAFYKHCTDEDARYAQSRLMPQASEPFAKLVQSSQERWGQIPRYYIESVYDRAISPRIQREMQKLSPCLLTFTIDSDHSSFFSTPRQLTQILSQIADQSPT